MTNRICEYCDKEINGEAQLLAHQTITHPLKYYKDVLRKIRSEVEQQRKYMDDLVHTEVMVEKLIEKLEEGGNYFEQ